MEDQPHSPPIDSDPLEPMLCFALYAAARATNRRYNALLEPWSLTYPQYLALVLLWSRRSLTVKEVAENMMLDSGTTSPLIKRLETRGFIRRERSTADERTVIVSVTDPGLALRTELAHIPLRIAAATQLDQSDGKNALSILHKVIRNLSATPMLDNDSSKTTPPTHA
ncbi:MarR family transcriptional regulator [Arthrobacter sp. TMP15]|uniref:MarR family winged helix-turn-helix transcriptional regulator n=1 Tax=Arthrobacter sp. TMP15 TaxID=3140789 RepID=UPI0031BA5235